eukprot:658273-Pleurochrysis_carterae.AAC.2
MMGCNTSGGIRLWLLLYIRLSLGIIAHYRYQQQTQHLAWYVPQALKSAHIDIMPPIHTIEYLLPAIWGATTSLQPQPHSTSEA